jgi:predicted PurR-regulated permease PerM
MTELGRRVLVGLAILAVVMVLYVASPFAEALLMAAVLASAFSPAFERLAVRLKQQRTLAGALFVALVVFALVLPVVGLTLAVAQQAEDAFQPIRTSFQQGGMNGVIDSLPAPLPVLARDAMARLPRGGQQLEELVKTLSGKVLGGVGYLFLATGNLVFQLSMMLVGFFFLLVDGPVLLRWIIKTSPLNEEQMKELFSSFRDVSVAVLLGSVGTALVQTLVALAGYWMAGARQALLLAAATFIGAFIPVVGAGSVVVASAVILFFTGHTSAAVFLAIWGIAVVSSIDNIVKPLLMRGRLEVNTGVTFFALLGGVAAFGPVGLLAGPLIVAFFLAVVRMCQKELTDPPVPPVLPIPPS